MKPTKFASQESCGWSLRILAGLGLLDLGVLPDSRTHWSETPCFVARRLVYSPVVLGS
jgi:hypothetical protein